MPATMTWAERNGAGGTETTATNLNFGAADTPNMASYSNPIRTSANSFEKWIRAKFVSDGTTTTAKDCRIFFTGTLPTGVTIVGKVTTTYATPSTTAMSGGAAVPTSYAAGLVLVGSGGIALGASGTTTYSTNYAVLQMQVASNANPGKVPASGNFTWTIQWDEY